MFITIIKCSAGRGSLPDPATAVIVTSRLAAVDDSEHVARIADGNQHDAVLLLEQNVLSVHTANVRMLILRTAVAQRQLLDHAASQFFVALTTESDASLPSLCQHVA